MCWLLFQQVFSVLQLTLSALSCVGVVSWEVPRQRRRVTIEGAALEQFVLNPRQFFVAQGYIHDPSPVPLSSQPSSTFSSSSSSLSSSSSPLPTVPSSAPSPAQLGM